MLFNDVSPSHINSWRWTPERTTLQVHHNLSTLPLAEGHRGGLSLGHSGHLSSRVCSYLLTWTGRLKSHLKETAEAKGGLAAGSMAKAVTRAATGRSLLEASSSGLQD